MKITVERTTHGIVLSTVHNCRYWHKLFIGYTVREAKAEFREYVRTGK